jgi:hypothetical protein
MSGYLRHRHEHFALQLILPKSLMTIMASGFHWWLSGKENHLVAGKNRPSGLGEHILPLKKSSLCEIDPAKPLAGFSRFCARETGFRPVLSELNLNGQGLPRKLTFRHIFSLFGGFSRYELDNCRIGE